MKITTYILLLFLCVSFVSCENNLDSPVRSNPDLKANSKVLVELFSNVMCVACVQSANYCDEITGLKGITINDTNVVVVNIHTSLFPGDPFYLFNSEMNGIREDYYNVIFNPAGFLMGGMMAAPFSAAQWTNQINQRLNGANAYSMTIENTIDTVSGTGSLLINVGQIDEALRTGLKLYAVVTESNLYFNSPNGKTIYNNILRQMLNGCCGENIAVSPGQPATFVKSYTLDGRIRVCNSRIIVFLQDPASREVLGVESIAF